MILLIEGTLHQPSDKPDGIYLREIKLSHGKVHSIYALR